MMTHWNEQNPSSVSIHPFSSSYIPPIVSPSVKRFEEIQAEMRDTFARKDADYAGDVPLANIKSSRNFGIEPDDAVFVRMADKFSRLCNLRKQGVVAQVENESFRDTLLDLANYAIIAVMLLDEMSNSHEAVQ